MKCRNIQEWISRAMDGELSDNERVELDKHLAGCADCRAVMAAWQVQAEQLRTMDAAPPVTAEVTWQNVQRAIRTSGATAERDASAVFGWRVRWAGAMLAAVFLGIVAGGAWRIASMQRSLGLAGESGADVEWVEAELPGASPMVYEDAETGWTVIWMVVAEEEKAEPRGS